MIHHLQLSFRAWNSTGASISGDELVEVLGTHVSTLSVIGSGQRWEAARIAIGLSFNDYEGLDEPHEAFAGAMQRFFTQFSNWLSRLSLDRCDRLRADGMNLDVFLGLWIDEDQLDLDLPCELFNELARLRLPLRMVSND